jgi:hypothetical protein
VQKIKRELAPVREPNSKSIYKQWYEIARAALTAQYTPSEYYMYGFHRNDRSLQDLSRYLSNTDWLTYVRPALTDFRWHYILDNKWLFNLYYRSLGFPVANIYAMLTEKGGITYTGYQLNNLQDLIIFLYKEQPKSIVIKPISGINGRFVYVIDSLEYSDAEIKGRLMNGNIGNVRKLLELVIGHGKNKLGLIIEEKIEQHPYFYEINPFTTNTIKIITLLTENNETEILTAVIKCGRKGSLVDNLAKGGFSRGIDAQRGELQDVGILSDSIRNTWIHEHPDLHTPFKKSSIPMWSRIRTAVHEISKCTMFARMVSWDILLTNEGPVILEGEIDPRIDIMQSYSSGFHTDRFVSTLNKYNIRIDFDSLNKINFHRFVSTLKRWI